MDGGGWRRRVMVEVLVARWGAVVLVMDGAPPRRPGRGGGRMWRRRDEGERCVLGSKGNEGGG